MADLFLDDQNLANGTTPAGPDFDDFEIVVTGFFSSDLAVGFSDNLQGLNPTLIWRFEQNATVLTGYDPVDRNAIVQLAIAGVRTISTGDGDRTIGITVRATLLDSYQSHSFQGDDLVQLGSVEVYASSQNSESFVTATASIEISDDVPITQDDFATTVDGLATGNILGNDTIGADDCTIDGPLLPDDIAFVTLADVAAGHGFFTTIRPQGGGNVDIGSTPVALTGRYGLLQIDPQGNWSYSVLLPGPARQDVFEYVIQDCDGDTDTGLLVITIPESDRQPTAGTVRVVLDDDVLTGGNPGGSGDDPDPPLPLTSTLVGLDGDLPVTFAFGSGGAPAGFSFDIATTPGSLIILQGSTRVITATITNAATGAIAITQNAPIVHDTLNGLAGDDTENNLVLSVPYTVTDRDGDVATGSLSIDIDDDTPTVQGDAASLTDGAANNAVSFNVLANDRVGADGNGVLAFAIGTYGAVTINGDGSQTYALNAAGLTAIGALGGGGQLVDTVRYTLTDRDGDSASGNVLITLIGRNDAPGFDQQAYVFLVWDDSKTFTLTASDPDQDPIDYSVGSPAPQDGIVTGGQDGQFAYEPQTTQPVVDGFTAVASDPGGGSDTAEVIVLVALAPIVTAPIAGIDFSIF